MPQFGTSWVNWSDYLAGQGSKPGEMAQGLSSELDTQAGSALTGIKDAESAYRGSAVAGGPGLSFTDALRRQANTATDELNAAQDTYGLQALMQKRRAGTGYTSGMGLYDAALTGSAAGSKFQGMKGKYRDLFGGMEAAQGRAGALQNSLNSVAASSQPIPDGKDGGVDGRVGGVSGDKERKRILAEMLARQRSRGEGQRGSTGRDHNLAKDPHQDPFGAYDGAGLKNTKDWFSRWGL